MLNEQITLTLLQASITGAGLVLAFYALIVPISRRLFEHRVHTLSDLTKEFKQSAKEIKPNYEDVEKLKDLTSEISDIQELPGYLQYGVGLTFFGYIVCILLSYAWVVDYERATLDQWLSLVFILTTVIFLAVGLIGIKDIQSLMRTEFEELKKTIEDVKSEAASIKTNGLEEKPHKGSTRLRKSARAK